MINQDIKLKIDAIASLYTGQEWSWDETKFILNGVETRLDSLIIDNEVTRLQAEYDSQEYARKRRADYPTIEECVHAILDNNLDALQSKRAEVKLRYPK